MVKDGLETPNWRPKGSSNSLSYDQEGVFRFGKTLSQRWCHDNNTGSWLTLKHAPHLSEMQASNIQNKGMNEAGTNTKGLLPVRCLPVKQQGPGFLHTTTRMMQRGVLQKFRNR